MRQIQNKLKVTESQEDKRAGLQQQLKETENKTDMECLYSVQLNHMIDRFKWQIKDDKRPISEQSAMLEKMRFSI